MQSTVAPSPSLHPRDKPSIASYPFLAVHPLLGPASSTSRPGAYRPGKAPLFERLDRCDGSPCHWPPPKTGFVRLNPRRLRFSHQQKMRWAQPDLNDAAVPIPIEPKPRRLADL